MLKTLRFVSLTCAAIVLGLTLAHVLEAPGKRQLSGAEWVVVQNTFYPGFAVLGGVGEVAGLLCSGALAMMERHRRFGGVLAAVAAIAFAGTLLSYAFGNRPINDQVAVWTAASLPPDWTSYRDRWDAAHTVGAALSAIAFLTLLVAALADSSVVGAANVFGGGSSPPRVGRDDTPSRARAGVSAAADALDTAGRTSASPATRAGVE
jgi:hypothetical protein